MSSSQTVIWFHFESTALTGFFESFYGPRKSPAPDFTTDITSNVFTFVFFC